MQSKTKTGDHDTMMPLRLGILKLSKSDLLKLDSILDEWDVTPEEFVEHAVSGVLEAHQGEDQWT